MHLKGSSLNLVGIGWVFLVLVLDYVLVASKLVV